jgi:hypothetical protein
MAALRFGKVGMAAIIDTREERITIDWGVSDERGARTVVSSLRVRPSGARVKDSRARLGVRDALCAMRDVQIARAKSAAPVDFQA